MLFGISIYFIFYLLDPLLYTFLAAPTFWMLSWVWYHSCYQVLQKITHWLQPPGTTQTAQNPLPTNPEVLQWIYWGALVHPPLLIGTNTLTSLKPYPLRNFYFGGAIFTSSNTSKGKRHCTHAQTQIILTVTLLQTLPLYLQVQMDPSCDIPIPSRSLSTLTLITNTSKELFIATLMSMMLKYTWRNACLLVPTHSNHISLESTNQSLHHPNQISV